MPSLHFTSWDKIDREKCVSYLRPSLVKEITHFVSSLLLSSVTESFQILYSVCSYDYFSTLHSKKKCFVLILNRMNLNAAAKMYVLIRHTLMVVLRRELWRAVDASWKYWNEKNLLRRILVTPLCLEGGRGKARLTRDKPGSSTPMFEWHSTSEVLVCCLSGHRGWRSMQGCEDWCVRNHKSAWEWSGRKWSGQEGFSLHKGGRTNIPAEVEYSLHQCMQHRQ